jgi:murein DD-endopeptidase MepM/ murein hydrolase activator NlpD
MSHNSLISRGLVAVAAVVIAMFPSHAAAADDVAESVGDDRPQAMSLPAPFSCGTEWRGSTYPGHGSHNWNLDLNRAGDEVGTDLGQPLLAQGDGVVVWFKQTGYNKGAGTYVEIDYGDVSVRYLHLVEASIPDDVAEIGAEVSGGGIIGLLGATGRVSGPHLHLEYWDSAEFEDVAWFRLPRGNHIPVGFDGQEMVASPGRPTDVARSTNCVSTSMREPWAGRRELGPAALASSHV